MPDRRRSRPRRVPDLHRTAVPLGRLAWPSRIGLRLHDPQSRFVFAGPYRTMARPRPLHGHQRFGDCRDYEPEFHRDIVFNHVLHELAHVLDRPHLFAERIENQDLLLFESLVVANEVQHEPASPTCGPGQSFIRIAIHLIARANRNGYDMRPAGVCRMHEFGLSPIGNYFDALGDELKQHPSTRFRDFPEPPIQFTELWNSDTQPRGGSA